MTMKFGFRVNGSKNSRFRVNGSKNSRFRVNGSKNSRFRVNGSKNSRFRVSQASGHVLASPEVRGEQHDARDKVEHEVAVDPFTDRVQGFRVLGF